LASPAGPRPDDRGPPCADRVSGVDGGHRDADPTVFRPGDSGSEENDALTGLEFGTRLAADAEARRGERFEADRGDRAAAVLAHAVRPGVDPGERLLDQLKFLLDLPEELDRELLLVGFR